MSLVLTPNKNCTEILLKLEDRLPNIEKMIYNDKQKCVILHYIGLTFKTNDLPLVGTPNRPKHSPFLTANEM